MSKVVLILPQNLISQSRFIFSHIDKNECDVIYYPPIVWNLQKFCRVLSNLIVAFIIINKLRKVINKKTLIFDQALTSRLTSILISIYAYKIKKCIFFLDSVYVMKNSEKIRFFRKLGFQLFTFDKLDSINYKLNYMNQFLFMPRRTSVIATYSSDFFFCGKAYNRIDVIKKIYRQLKYYGYKCDFVVPEIWGYNIGYKEYYIRVMQCKCIIDIIQDHQHGITRRPLDALFFNKKLITNYKDIQTYDFYNESNILVIDNDRPIDYNVLRHFLKTPVVPIPNEIKMKYDVNTWIKKISNNNS